MISALRAEFRKLVTVRSTYILSGLSFALVIFYAFYVVGFRTAAKDPSVHAGVIVNHSFLAEQIFGALQAVGVFGAIVAVLLLAHEYRYNTIMYTLTLANRRTKVLLAKMLVVTGFMMFFALVVALLAPSMAALGLHMHHMSIVHQTFRVGDVLWRTLFYGGGYGLAALLLALFFRNVIAGIVLLLVIPGPVEQLLGLALNSKKVYLPFAALNHVVGQMAGDGSIKQLSVGRAALVFAAYMAIGWLVGWLLFVRRDAN